MRKSMLELVSPVQHDADIVRLLLDFGEWLAWSETRNCWRGMKNSEVKEHFAKQCRAIYLRFPHDGWKTRGDKTVHPREWKRPANAVSITEFDDGIPKLKAKSSNPYDT